MSISIDGRWQLDPERSSVEFHAPNFWGLATVKGRFDRYNGTLDLAAQPAIELTVDANSLNTKNARRDKHLRSADFFDVANHPQVRFVSDSAALEGDTLNIHGRLSAAGKEIPLDIAATVRDADGELDIDATTTADRRELGMTWNRLGSVGATSTLVLQGKLVRAGTG